MLSLGPVNLFRFDDYRTYLQSRLEEIYQKRPGYSLRAFARDLGVGAPRLANLMNRKKGLSLVGAIDLARRLGLNTLETEYFCDLVQKEHARSPRLREFAHSRLERRHYGHDTASYLPEELFSLISHWHHYAILQLLFLKDFEGNPKWISKRLGISFSEARSAWDRLQQLKLVEKKEGKWMRKKKTFFTSSDIPSEANRRHQFQLLELAEHALKTQNIEEREFNSNIFAIDKKKLPHAKSMIRQFQNELEAFLEEGPRTDVYVYTSQLFRLTNVRRTNE